MKKGTCKRFMAMAMSLVTALGTGYVNVKLNIN